MDDSQDEQESLFQWPYDRAWVREAESVWEAALRKELAEAYYWTLVDMTYDPSLDHGSAAYGVLCRVAQAKRHMLMLEQAAVEAARAVGMPLRSVGEALDMSTSNAHKRFGPKSR